MADEGVRTLPSASVQSTARHSASGGHAGASAFGAAAVLVLPVAHRMTL